MGKTVSHYRLDEEIAQGGMGRVYKAYDLTLDRTVVIKLLAPDLTADEDSRKRFFREARLASALDHPNICTIYEIADADGQFFIAMQHVPGKTLKRVVGNRPLDLDSLLSIALQVGDALSAAHAKGIIHRDIKSSNIIITPRGQAKILDFGLAKLLSEKGRSANEPVQDELTRMGAPLGTPSYMSPEQARGERADHRSDIYSFGVVLYEMATGRLPFRGQSSVEVMNAVLNEAYKPARQSNDKLPEAVAAIIDQAMSRSRGGRYQSVQQMLEDLQQVSLSLRFGLEGVPDGIVTPFALPRRQKSRGSLGQFINRLFARGAAADQQAPNASAGAQSETTLHDFSVPGGAKKSLVVLPFRNLGGDAESDFYGLSLADSLITELARARAVAVAPSSSVAKYAGDSVDPARVRAELGADAVLIGNFLKAGERLRVTAQLVDAASGAMLWSDKIDAAAGDVLAIQDHISKSIITGLSVGGGAVDPMQLLKDESPAIRVDAVRTLKFSHDSRALAALVGALRDSNLKVKSEAVQAVVHLGEQAAGPVIQLLNDSVDEGDNLSARFAAKALGLIGDRSISGVLIELLRSDDKFVACDAALALGRLKESKAVAPLLAMLEEPNGNARFAAAEALGEICDPSARDALQRRLKDDDEGVRAKARWALSRLRMLRERVEV
jgi:serine/threonine-protein kinase